jgi:hypothetical protein
VNEWLSLRADALAAEAGVPRGGLAHGKKRLAELDRIVRSTS